VSVSTISAEIRTEFGKGAARRVRRAGRVPAVLYGHGEPPKHLALPVREFATAIRHGGMTQVLTVNVSDGSTETVLPKAIQRDPIRNTYEHADLLLVRRGEKVTVDIPVQLVGEAAKGTLVMLENNRIAIRADATTLPDHLEASIDGLDAGERVTAAQVALPPGAELVTDPETAIAVISVAPSAEEMEEAEAPAVELELEPTMPAPAPEAATES
jgi:large subunit ribosomal protein L25